MKTTRQSFAHRVDLQCLIERINLDRKKSMVDVRKSTIGRHVDPRYIHKQSDGSLWCVCLPKTHCPNNISSATFQKHLVLQSRRFPLVSRRPLTAHSATSRGDPPSSDASRNAVRLTEATSSRVESSGSAGETHCDLRNKKGRISMDFVKKLARSQQEAAQTLHRKHTLKLCGRDSELRLSTRQSRCKRTSQ